MTFSLTNTIVNISCRHTHRALALRFFAEYFHNIKSTVALHPNVPRRRADRVRKLNKRYVDLPIFTHAEQAEMSLLWLLDELEFVSESKREDILDILLSPLTDSESDTKLLLLGLTDAKMFGPMAGNLVKRQSDTTQYIISSCSPNSVSSASFATSVHAASSDVVGKLLRMSGFNFKRLEPSTYNWMSGDRHMSLYEFNSTDLKYETQRRLEEAGLTFSSNILPNGMNILAIEPCYAGSIPSIIEPLSPVEV